MPGYVECGFDAYLHAKLTPTALQLKACVGAHKTIVAMTSKMDRIAWAILAKGESFDIDKAFAS